jgi:hypothetical protein
MKCNFLYFLLTAAIIMSISCKNMPPDADNDYYIQEPAAQENFDPTRVTQQQYTVTMDEVRHFIEQLNNTIQRRNYNGWRAALAPAYFEEISSPDNLRQLSELPAMKTRGITLRSPQDYFTHVVVPSRANSRVDDIEFVTRTRVKAFTISVNNRGEEQRLRLYDLEKVGDSWRIIN